MPYPEFSAGQILTAGMLSDMQWQEVEQGIQQVVNNSTTFVDTNIVVPVVAGAKYRYRLLVGYSTSTTADIKFRWQAPSNGEVRRWTWGIGNENTKSQVNNADSVNFRRPITNTAVSIGGTGTSNTQSYHEEGLLLGGDGGNCVFQFAQITAEVSDTSITGSTRVEYLRIE